MGQKWKGRPHTQGVPSYVQMLEYAQPPEHISTLEYAQPSILPT